MTWQRPSGARSGRLRGWPLRRGRPSRRAAARAPPAQRVAPAVAAGRTDLVAAPDGSEPELSMAGRPGQAFFIVT